MQTSTKTWVAENTFSFISKLDIPRDINCVLLQLIGNEGKFLIQKSFVTRDKTWKDEVKVTIEKIKDEHPFLREDIKYNDTLIGGPKIKIWNFWALSGNLAMIKKIDCFKAPLLIIYAACSGNFQVATKYCNKRFITLKVKNNTDFAGAAIRSHRPEALQFFTERGFCVDDDTAKLAAKKGDFECLKLLRVKPFISSFSETFCAIDGGNMECILYLAEGLGQEWNDEIFYQACKNGNLELIEKFPPRDNSIGSVGCEWASVYGQKKMLEKLFDLGYVASSECLEKAYRAKKSECCNLLLEKGVIPSEAVLNMACERGDQKMTEICISKGVKPGSSTMEWAISNRHEHICEFLIKEKCPIPTYIFCFRMSYSLMKKFLDCGAKITSNSIKNIYSLNYPDLLKDLKPENFECQSACDALFDTYMLEDLQTFSNLLNMDLEWTRKEQFCEIFTKRSKIEDF